MLSLTLHISNPCTLPIDLGITIVQSADARRNHIGATNGLRVKALERCLLFPKLVVIQQY